MSDLTIKLLGFDEDSLKRWLDVMGEPRIRSTRHLTIDGYALCGDAGRSERRNGAHTFKNGREKCHRSAEVHLLYPTTRPYYSGGIEYAVEMDKLLDVKGCSYSQSYCDEYTRCIAHEWLMEMGDIEMSWFDGKQELDGRDVLDLWHAINIDVNR